MAWLAEQANRLFRAGRCYEGVDNGQIGISGLIGYNVNHWEPSSGFLHYVKRHPDIRFIVESCWSSQNHFVVGRFLHWTAIIWVTCMSFVGWYINYWDLIEKNRLTWQVHTRLSLFWRQQDPNPHPRPLQPFPPLRAVTSVPNSAITIYSSQHLNAQPHPRSIRHRGLLFKSLVIYRPKEIPHCRLVAGGRVQWCLFWFNRSGTPPTTPPTGTAVKFWPKSLLFFFLLFFFFFNDCVMLAYFDCDTSIPSSLWPFHIENIAKYA